MELQFLEPNSIQRAEKIYEKAYNIQKGNLPMDHTSSLESTLKEIVQQMLKAGQPLKIILFGSQARGEATSESDYDLLVIENSELPRYRRSAPYRRALRYIGRPKDILVWTPLEIEEWKNVQNAFITTAMREGQILYER
ncbi:MAG: nucleotidyltransferase domain-containing protein [Chloroflexota bacterium]